MASGYLWDNAGFYLELNVDSVSSGFTTSAARACVPGARILYPKHIFQNPISVHITTRDEAEREYVCGQLVDWIYKTSALSGRAEVLSFAIPSHGWYYDVVLTQSPMELRRFVVGPEMDLTLVLAADKLEGSDVAVGSLDRPYYWESDKFQPVVPTSEQLRQKLQRDRQTAQEILKGMSGLGQMASNWWNHSVLGR